MTLLLIHGPNLNRLGQRKADLYGTLTLPELENQVSTAAQARGFSLSCFQSNHEGALIDFLQAQAPTAQGLLINLGALTHYSYALHDALLDTGLPAIEVHLSPIHEREIWRRTSVIRPVCLAQITGKQEAGYLEALHLLIQHLQKNR